MKLPPATCKSLTKVLKSYAEPLPLRMGRIRVWQPLMNPRARCTHLCVSPALPRDDGHIFCAEYQIRSREREIHRIPVGHLQRPRVSENLLAVKFLGPAPEKTRGSRMKSGTKAEVRVCSLPPARWHRKPDTQPGEGRVLWPENW